MLSPQPTIQPVHEGRTYTVALHLCPDGIIDGATRSALANALASVVAFRDVLGDPANTDRLFDAITDIRDDSGVIVPRPWKTWARDFDIEALEELADFFFSDVHSKMTSWKGSGKPIPTMTMRTADLISHTISMHRITTPTPI